MGIALFYGRSFQKAKGKVMITNIKQAATYLGISARTVIRMINEGVFPKPSQVMEIGKGKVLRSWKEEDLESFRPYLRPSHRPKKSDKKCHTD